MPDVQTRPAHPAGRPRRLRTPAVALVVAVLASLVALASTASPAAADELVGDEAAFRAAWGDPGVTLIRLDRDIHLTSCFPQVRDATTPITVVGDGHTVHQGCAHHAFASSGSGPVELRDLRIGPGSSVTPAIDTSVEVAGPLTITGSTIDGVRAGAVRAEGPIVASDTTITRSGGDAMATTSGVPDTMALRCTRCRITDNGGAGLVAAASGARVNVNDSEIAGNDGNGVVGGATTWVIRSTVAGNEGIGVLAKPLVYVVNSTFAHNLTDGVYAYSAGSGVDGNAIAVLSTFVGNGRNNLGGATSASASLSVLVGAGNDACRAPSTSGTASFADDTTCNLDGNSHEGPGVDPRLGHLAHEGGPTRTMRPLLGSPLLAAVPSGTCDVYVQGWDSAQDQRGYDRPATPGAPCDIGAVQIGGTSSAPCSPPFADVTAAHPFCRDIAWMSGNGHSTGWPDGTYRPGLDVSRQAMAAFLWRIAGSPEAGTTSSFPDVPPGHDFEDAIAWLADEGITNGYDDGTFRPTAPITRQAVAAMLWRLADRPAPVPVGFPAFTDVGFDHPFHDAIAWLAEVQVTTGYDDGGFHPTDRTTRQAMAAFLQRYAGVHQPPLT